MRRFSIACVCSLLLAGCRIEQTPQHYIDRQDTPADQLLSSEAEIGRKLLSLPTALQRRSQLDVELALAPRPDLFVFGLEGGAPGSSRGLVSSLDSFAAGRYLAPANLDVTVGPQNDVAWFRVELAPAEVQEILRFSGVFVRQEGDWRLAQAHLSTAPADSSRVPPDLPTAPPAGDG